MIFARVLAALASLAAATPLAANPYSDHVSVRLLSGWQQADGSHLAGLELRLAKGWKTYWRSPGDAGVPPLFSWDGSGNVASVDVIWPRPEVFYQNGLRSIGYSDHVVLPLRIQPKGDGASLAVFRGTAGHLEPVFVQKGFSVLHVHVQRCVAAVGLTAIEQDDAMASGPTHSPRPRRPRPASPGLGRAATGLIRTTHAGRPGRSRSRAAAGSARRRRPTPRGRGCG